MGCTDSGTISWHSIKPFLTKLIEIESLLNEDRGVLESERQARLDEFNKRLAEKQRKKEEKEAAALVDNEGSSKNE